MTTLQITSTKVSVPRPRHSMYFLAYLIGGPAWLCIGVTALRFGWVGAVLCISLVVLLGLTIAVVFRAIESDRISDGIQQSTQVEEHSFSGPMARA